jgi:dihydroflavonol-4-reductase
MAGATFVTGGSGVVGRAVVERLVAEGRRVVALARSRPSAEALERLGARPVAGDVLDPGALQAAMGGCEVVYHIAGANELCPERPSCLYRLNITGTLNSVRAARRAGARRVVYTSSAASLGEPAGTVGDERTRHRGWFLSHYEHSKHEAEKTAFSAGAAAGVEVVSVNPSSVQGPGRSGGTTLILRAYLDGKLRFFVDATMSLVDVRDCAEGHLQAELRGAPGERYVLSGATLDLRRALDIVAPLARSQRAPRLLPPRVALAAAGGAEALGRLRGRPLPVCRELVRTLLHGHAYDGSRASRELGLGYTPVEETLTRAVQWLADQGLVPRPRRAP